MFRPGEFTDAGPKSLSNVLENKLKDQTLVIGRVGAVGGFAGEVRGGAALVMEAEVAPW